LVSLLILAEFGFRKILGEIIVFSCWVILGSYGLAIILQLFKSILKICQNKKKINKSNPIKNKNVQTFLPIEKQ
jgi:hypothetical protein